VIKLFHLSGEAPQGLFDIVDALVQRCDPGTLCLFPLLGSKARRSILLAFSKERSNADLAGLARDIVEPPGQMLRLFFRRRNTRGKVIAGILAGGGTDQKTTKNERR
jgi:hypothetical protein